MSPKGSQMNAGNSLSSATLANRSAVIERLSFRRQMKPWLYSLNGALAIWAALFSPKWQTAACGLEMVEGKWSAFGVRESLEGRAKAQLTSLVCSLALFSSPTEYN